MEQKKVLLLGRTKKDGEKIMVKTGSSKFIYKPQKVNQDNKPKKPFKGKPFNKFKGKHTNKKPLKLLKNLSSKNFEIFAEREDTKEAREILNQICPTRFNYCKPKIYSKHIFKDVLAAKNEKKLVHISRRALKRAVENYANNPLYRKLYRIGAKRFDFFGNEAGEVTTKDIITVNNTIKCCVKRLKEKSKAKLAQQVA